MKRFFTFAMCLLGVSVLAQQAVVELPVSDFLSQFLAAVKTMGGTSAMVKLSTIIMLVVASMKVSVLNKYIWSKLGKLQIWLAPCLGLIAGLVGAGDLTLAKVFVYASAGAGAVFLHEILDLVKAIPGLGPVYVGVIDMVEGVLGGGSQA